MNRKLRNTILAFSVTGMLLAVGLMAAGPVHPEQATPAGTLAERAAPAPKSQGPLMPLAGERSHSLREQADAVLAQRIDAHVRQFEDGMQRVDSVEQAVAASTGLVAVITSEAVLARLAAESASLAPRDEAEATPPPRKRRSGSVRHTIAVPYFSFARGMGRGGRS